MILPPSNSFYRILVIDDNPSIHQDFSKILMKPTRACDDLPGMESTLFGTEIEVKSATVFELDCAFQGSEGLDMVQKALADDRPYALAFVDGRMPPGWDGIETIRQLWRVCPELQVVLCTAYSDYSWQEIHRLLGGNDNLLILKKPFDNVEVLQMGHALTRKWALHHEIQKQINELDDTVQKRTQEKDQIGALLKAALEHSPAGIIISDVKDGKIQWANPAALLVLDEAYPFFSEIPDLTPHEDLQVFRPGGKAYASNELPLARAMGNGETIQNEEFIIRNASGHERWISSNAAPIRDPGGTISAGILIVQDITERIQAQKQHEKLQHQLIQAQKMECLGVLAGGVTHDFNNLLQVIGGNIELFMIENQAVHRDSEEFSRLQTVVKSIDRAGQLVRQLMLFSRKAEVKKQRVDLNHEVAETVQMLKRIIPKNVSIELNMDPSEWSIHADPTQVEQVLLNLGGNAVDAMPHGGRLSISTQNLGVNEEVDRHLQGLRPVPYVLMTLADTGYGMDDQTITHAFEPFFTTKEIGKGTGLGLASVYGIVKGHDGSIHCVSKPGHGTTFKIYWPAILEKNTDEVAPVSSGLRGGAETILIVDDASCPREMITEKLKSLGYNTLTATNGEDALERYIEKGRSIDMIILDLNMAGMDGYHCLLELLRMEPKPRVLITSGYSALVQIKELIQAGAAGVVDKPCKLSELATVVRSILDGGSAVDGR